MNKAHQTTKHEIIMNWVENRNGVPAYFKDDQGNQQKASLSIHFLGKEEEDKHLRKLSWQEFFDYFEGANLAFTYQDDMESQFYEFVDRR